MSIEFSNPAQPRWRYDVFLSFRGEDTRRTFVDHLYYSLKDAGVNVFMDDTGLPRGEIISSQLKAAIRSSRISVVVFSRNYANSRWCLQELVEIMQCRNSLRQMVLPVFYDIDPSDVRKQSGSFEEAFIEHELKLVSAEEKEVVAQWRAALTEAGKLSGWDLTNLANGKEAKIVRDIVWLIWNELKNTNLDVTQYPVGLDPRLDLMKQRLHLGSSGVLFVGIYGIGGIGKTTLARAVYNQLFHAFEATSFIANVRESANQPNGLVLLQEQLLHDITKVSKTELSLGNIYRGINVIKERLCNRRVLIVLDDLSDIEQLRALAREREWFGLGSRIIITTRDIHLLNEIKVDYEYMPEELNDAESLLLFSWHAFRSPQPKEEFVKLSEAIIRYCQGLPLALEVLGSHLLDRNEVEWRSALDRLKRAPLDRIQSQLKLSFDALNDANEKEIFLHIACFFVGHDKDYVMKILNGCGLSAEIGLSVLTKRCLVKITNRNELQMHDLIRDMGREIVRKESPKNPGARSRLWTRNDVLATLLNHLGTHQVEGLALTLLIDEATISAEAFEKMSRLRLLQLNRVHVHGDFGLFSKELRWLCWRGFPFHFIPEGFYMGNLVAIDMQYSKLQEIWKATKFLGNLKVLNLSHSQFLIKTPDFSKFPKLEELILEDCPEMKSVDQSIGHLKRLVRLNLQNCRKLRCLPSSICRVTSLQYLNISGCSGVDRLPDDLGDMHSLSILLADETSLTRLPPSMVGLKKLKTLSLCGCKASSYGSVSSLLWSWISKREVATGSNLLTISLYGLSSLTELRLRDCNLSDDAVPAEFGSVGSLKVLDLCQNNFSRLPAAIGRLSKLFSINVEHCTKLEFLPDMPPSLRILNANNCISLERISVSTCHNTEMLGVMNCSKLVEIFGLEKWKAGGSIRLDGCKILSTEFKEFLMKNWEGGRFVIPGDDVPDWFQYKSPGPSLSFQLPPCDDCKLEMITLGIVYTPNTGPTPDVECPVFTLADKASKLNLTDYLENVFPKSPLPQEDHTFMFHLAPSDIMGDSRHKYTRVQLDLDCDARWIIKAMGVHLQTDLCRRCHLSPLESSVAGSTSTIQEIMQCEQHDAPAIYTEQTRANPKRGICVVGPSHSGCPSMESLEHKRVRYELP